MKRVLTACAALLCTSSHATAADLELSLGDIGLREYYCTAQMTLTNQSDQPIMEVSGHFYLYIGDERVGRSKGTWFMNLGPGESVKAVFETPNAPCDDVERYEFVVGACRLEGPGFDPVGACAAKIAPVAPIEVAIPES